MGSLGVEIPVIRGCLAQPTSRPGRLLALAYRYNIIDKLAFQTNVALPILISDQNLLLKVKTSKRMRNQCLKEGAEPFPFFGIDMYFIRPKMQHLKTARHHYQYQ